MPAERRDIDQHTVAVPRVAGLVDPPGDLVPRRDRPALAQRTQVAAAQRAGDNVYANLAGDGTWRRDGLDRDPPAAMKSGRPHAGTPSVVNG